MISQTAEYALRAMACLALTPGELVPTSSVAERTRVPSNYLAKVLQQLGDAGLVDSRRGVGGGYKLSRPADEITLVEVVRAVDRLERIQSCPLGIEQHGSSLCALHRIEDSAAAAVIDILDGVTLADLLADEEQNKPLCENGEAVSLRVPPQSRKT